jgi:hydroxyacylglutathione hydrolase
MNTITQPLPLEDAWNDVLSKAIHGTAVDDKNLAASANIIPATLKTILAGELPPDDTLRRLAIAVGLRPTAVLDSAHKRFQPKPLDAARWPGIVQIPSRYMDYIVNCYLSWDIQTKDAVLFDTGTEFEPIRKLISENQLKLSAVYITHAHGDHIAILDELIKTYQVKVFAPKQESVTGALVVQDGAEFTIGSLKAKAVLTDGHSVEHLSFVLSGNNWPAPVAIVGDAIFSGSMGKGLISYSRLKQNVQDKILKLPPETLLCPGHGPTTTVEEESKHNPFA